MKDVGKPMPLVYVYTGQVNGTSSRSKLIRLLGAKEFHFGSQSMLSVFPCLDKLHVVANQKSLQKLQPSLLLRYPLLEENTMK